MATTFHPWPGSNAARSSSWRTGWGPVSGPSSLKHNTYKVPSCVKAEGGIGPVPDAGGVVAPKALIRLIGCRRSAQEGRGRPNQVGAGQRLSSQAQVLGRTFEAQGEARKAPSPLTPSLMRLSFWGNGRAARCDG